MYWEQERRITVCTGSIVLGMQKRKSNVLCEEDRKKSGRGGTCKSLMWKKSASHLEGKTFSLIMQQCRSGKKGCTQQNLNLIIRLRHAGLCHLALETLDMNAATWPKNVKFLQ